MDKKDPAAKTRPPHTTAKEFLCWKGGPGKSNGDPGKSTELESHGFCQTLPEELVWAQAESHSSFFKCGVFSVACSCLHTGVCVCWSWARQVFHPFTGGQVTRSCNWGGLCAA